MSTMPQSDNPIFKAKANSLIQECFYLFLFKEHSLQALRRAPRKKQLKLAISNICAVSPEMLSSAGARQVLAHSLNFSLLQVGLRYFLHHKFSEQTDQLERCPAFLKTAEPKPLTMNTLNSREGRRTCSTAWQPAKRFFLPFSGRRIALWAELMPKCKRQRPTEREREQPSSKHFSTALLIKHIQPLTVCRSV